MYTLLSVLPAIQSIFYDNLFCMQTYFDGVIIIIKFYNPFFDFKSSPIEFLLCIIIVIVILKYVI